MEIFTQRRSFRLKFTDKLKVAKEAARLGLGGTKQKIGEIQKLDAEFKEKELAILEKYEGLVLQVLSNQKIILEKLDRLLK